jgi:hypothetical protein
MPLVETSIKELGVTWGKCFASCRIKIPFCGRLKPKEGSEAMLM